jgi:D-3-phosphoglycerate dehydrogenase
VKFSEIKVLIGRDHTLGDTLDEIANCLAERGFIVARLPAGETETHCQIPADSQELLKDTNILVISSRTRVDRRIISQASRLQAIIFPSIGYNSCDLEAASEFGVKVVNGVTPENYEGVAEGTVLLMLASLLQFNKKQRWLREGIPNPKASAYSSQMLKGKTIGLIGYGRIARETIRRLQHWGVAKFLVFSRRQQDSEFKNVEFCAFEKLLRESDVVSIHCPLSEETNNLIDKNALTLMKPTAIIVNTSRGGIINEEALTEALLQGVIAGAAIDTFAVEPLPRNSSLRQIEDIALTPHNIGHTSDLFKSLVPKAVRNICDLAQGLTPEDTVNAAALVQRKKLAPCV